LRRRTVPLPPPLPRLPGGSCQPPRNRRGSRAGYPRLAPRSLQCRAHVRPALSGGSVNPAATAFPHIPASPLPRPTPHTRNRNHRVHEHVLKDRLRTARRRQPRQNPAETAPPSPRRPLLSMMCSFSSLVNRLRRPPDPELTCSSATASTSMCHIHTKPSRRNEPTCG